MRAWTCVNTLRENMQLLLNDEIGGLFDSQSGRLRFAEKILQMAGCLPKPEAFRKYLMQQPTPVLAERLRIMAAEAGDPVDVRAARQIQMPRAGI